MDSESLQEGNKACATRTLLCDVSKKFHRAGYLFSSREDSLHTIIILILGTTVSIKLEVVMSVVVAIEIVAVVDDANHKST